LLFFENLVSNDISTTAHKFIHPGNRFSNRCRIAKKMKNLIFPLLACFFISGASFAQSSGLTLYADSLHKEAPASQFQIEITNYIINNSGQTVTFKWTRTLQQPFPSGWVTNFCDDSLCYLNPVSSAIFNLPSGDTGLLKPVFYPYENPGAGIYRIKLESLTPAVPYLANIVYEAVATEAMGAQNLEQPEILLLPNPADHFIFLSFAGTDFEGIIQIFDASGRTIKTFSEAGSILNLDISSLDPGSYTLIIRPLNNRFVVSRTFIKR